MRRYSLVIALTLFLSLVATTGAQAVVVNDGGTEAGVALVPSAHDDTTTYLQNVGINPVTPSGPCSDPWLSPEMALRGGALCWNGGATPGNAVMHGNETFAITWDPQRSYWSTTKDYVQTFLRDVADGSGTLTSPYAVTGQYSDAGGRAANASKYGGGCTDLGDVSRGATCVFPNAIGNAAGSNYPATDGCATTGTSNLGPSRPAANQYCLIDDQLRPELTNMVNSMGLIGRTQHGYTPLLVMLVPPQVEVCLDSSGKLCSANSNATAKFCSYHSYINVGGTNVAYVVQPWTEYTECDEPNIPPLPSFPEVDQLEKDAGARLVSPISQAQIGSVVNPWLDGWFALEGDEINDNGITAAYHCQPVPVGDPWDKVTVGDSAQNPYYLQQEFNNAGAIESDPYASECRPSVALSPSFVVPSPVDAGDVVAFDGTATASSLIVPNGNFQWNFGDGTTAVGPSVEHSYANGGTYTVKLTVTDRGGNVAGVSQRIIVLGAVNSTPPAGSTTPPAGSTPPPPPPVGSKRLQAHLQLTLQSLRSVLRGGVTLRVTSNERANGIVTLSITRNAAKHAHIKTGRGSSVVIGRGTTSAIKAGTVRLRLRLSRAVSTRLGRLRHVKLTIRVSLVAADGDRGAWVAAGQY